MWKLAVKIPDWYCSQRHRRTGSENLYIHPRRLNRNTDQRHRSVIAGIRIRPRHQSNLACHRIAARKKCNCCRNNETVESTSVNVITRSCRSNRIEVSDLLINWHHSWIAQPTYNFCITMLTTCAVQKLNISNMYVYTIISECLIKPPGVGPGACFWEGRQSDIQQR